MFGRFWAILGLFWAPGSPSNHLILQPGFIEKGVREKTDRNNFGAIFRLFQLLGSPGFPENAPGEILQKRNLIQTDRSPVKMTSHTVSKMIAIGLPFLRAKDRGPGGLQGPQGLITHARKLIETIFGLPGSPGHSSGFLGTPGFRRNLIEQKQGRVDIWGMKQARD